MIISRERLLGVAEAAGFRADMLEKAIHLLALLEGFRSHPFLKERLALKGGTALNLFLFAVPRLSVDIDLNYVGAWQREKMLEERPRVEEAVQAVCAREGFSVRRKTEEHAGTELSLRYESAMGQGENLEVDLNFMFREPLWPIVKQDSRKLGAYVAAEIPLVDIHELAAGKLAALLARHQARDLFDVHQLLTRLSLDRDRLRLGFVVYGAGNRRDWRTISPEDVEFDASELRTALVPLLRSDSVQNLDDAADLGKQLVKECRQALDVVLPLSNGELQFLDRLLEHGEISASLLTTDAEMVSRISRHPLLNWKALNVRQYRGRSRGE